MIIALMDECRRIRLCEIEDEPEPRFVLAVDGFDYYYEHRPGLEAQGNPVYVLVDAEVTSGLGRTE